MSSLLKQVLWSIPVSIAVTDVFVSIIRVDGISMQPTFNPKGESFSDWVLVEKFSVKLLHKYRRGDVVVLWAPDQPQQQLIKRMIAVEGDTVLLPRGEAAGGHSSIAQRIPQGRCWIEGDNAEHSGDSRTAYGAVHLGLLEGRVACVVWPPWRVSAVNSSVPKHRVATKEDS